jgi:hypothetical protein
MGKSTQGEEGEEVFIKDGRIVPEKETFTGPSWSL